MSRVPFRNREPAHPLPYFRDRLDGRFLHFRMARQPEVIVRSQHDHPLAFDDDFGVLLGLDHPEIGITTCRHHFLCRGILPALLEQVHVQSSVRRRQAIVTSCYHGTTAT